MAGTHRSRAFRTAIPGVEALALLSDTRFPRHAHDQFGIGVMYLGGHRSWSSIGLIEAKAGDAIMTNPGEMHDGSPVHCAIRGWNMLYFTPARVAYELADETGGELEIVRPAVSDPCLTRFFVQAFTRATTLDIDPLAVEEGCLLLLQHVLSRHGTWRSMAKNPSPDVAKARQRLDDAPEQPTTLAELAALVETSRFQLVRAFNRELGVTPHAYLLQRRVQTVRRLLIAGRTLSEAALEAGFADQSHMTRLFTRQLGISPGRFRDALC